jgi:calcineurin-like phosphoesterase family protein
MTVWFTSDEHHGHRKIIEYSSRPFACVEEMTEIIVNRHNARVGKYDRVWHLGDFALNERLVKKILPRLNGEHALIAGNHDKCHACHKKHLAMAKKYAEWGFVYVAQYALERLSDDIEVTLSHLPYVGDSITKVRPNGEERYPEYRLADNGGWLLHGHVHNLWKVRDRMVNVGVDQWGFAPVSAKEICDLIRQQGVTTAAAP